MSPIAVRPLAFITGASSGIGEALAHQFAQRGYDLFLCARRTDRLAALQKLLEASGTRVAFAACDVTQAPQVKAAVEAARRAFGKIDVVIANAGIGYTQGVDRSILEDYQRTFDVNVHGVLTTVLETLSDLESSRGKLAIIGSVMSYLALPGSSAYSMSKFAVRALADSIRGELKPKGVSVTLACPGFVATEIRIAGGKRDPIPGWLAMSSEKAARQIARAIEARKGEIGVTFHAKLAIWLARHFPWTIDLLLFLMGSRGRKLNQQMER